MFSRSSLFSRFFPCQRRSSTPPSLPTLSLFFFLSLVLSWASFFFCCWCLSSNVLLCCIYCCFSSLHSRVTHPGVAILCYTSIPMLFYLSLYQLKLYQKMYPYFSPALKESLWIQAFLFALFSFLFSFVSSSSSFILLLSLGNTLIVLFLFYVLSKFSASTLRSRQSSAYFFLLLLSFLPSLLLTAFLYRDLLPQLSLLLLTQGIFLPSSLSCR